MGAVCITDNRRSSSTATTTTFLQQRSCLCRCSLATRRLRRRFVSEVPHGYPRLSNRLLSLFSLPLGVLEKARNLGRCWIPFRLPRSANKITTRVWFLSTFLSLFRMSVHASLQCVYIPSSPSPSPSPSLPLPLPLLARAPSLHCFSTLDFSSCGVFAASVPGSQLRRRTCLR